MSNELNARQHHRLPIGMLLFLLAAISVLVIAFGGRFHGFKIYDDAYMFVRYADHLIAGQGMVWNVGDGPVYGATSLAYVFVLIPFRWIFPHDPAAALFCSSFFWGLVFIGLIFRLALKTLAPEKAYKPFLVGFLFLGLIAAASTLRAHFASGMETTFVMSYLTVCIILWERQQQGLGNAWVAGIIGGLAWWVRPDLLIFTWGVPGVLALILADREAKAQWLRVLMVTMAVTGIALLGAKMVTGAWLPLSFWAKGTRLYGREFTAAYRWLPFAEGARFVARVWPALLLIGMGTYVKWSRLREAYSELDKAIFVAMAVFAAYFAFFVLQVMGFGQRFYFPLLPFLFYLGLRELLAFPENLRLGPGIQFKRFPLRYERIGMVVVGAVLLYYGVEYGRGMKQAQLEQRLAVFDAQTTYQAELTDYWAKLDQLSALPQPMSIATTEVGMPAALNPNRKIYDLAALNEPKLVAQGLNATTVLSCCAADLIYLPHDHYAQLNKSLAESEAFAQRYATFSAKEMKAMMGIAIRKDSPYATDLYRIFLGK